MCQGFEIYQTDKKFVAFSKILEKYHFYSDGKERPVKILELNFITQTTLSILISTEDRFSPKNLIKYMFYLTPYYNANAYDTININIQLRGV